MKKAKIRDFLVRLLAVILVVSISISIFPLRAEAKDSYYDSSNLYKISKADIVTISNSSITPTPILKNNKVWYKFSNGASSVFIDTNALYGATNPTNEKSASKQIKNGLNGGTTEYSYTRLVQEKLSDGSVSTSLYRITVSSATTGSRHTIMIDIDARAGIRINPKWKIENTKVLGKSVSLTNMNQYTFNMVKDNLQGLVKKTASKDITPTVEVSSNSKQKYKLSNGKYAHKGNFSSVYYKAKGKTGKSNSSIAGFLKVAIETAKTASELGSSVSIGGLVSLASLGLSTIQTLKPVGNSIFETKEQFLSNATKNKMCYKARFESPVRMTTIGDYVQMIFYTNKNADSYGATLTLKFN